MDKPKSMTFKDWQDKIQSFLISYDQYMKLSEQEQAEYDKRLNAMRKEYEEWLEAEGHKFTDIPKMLTREGGEM